MDLAEMQVYGDISWEYRDYKIKVSKHNKQKSKIKNREKKDDKEVVVNVDWTLKEVVFKLKFN